MSYRQERPQSPINVSCSPEGSQHARDLTRMTLEQMLVLMFRKILPKDSQTTQYHPWNTSRIPALHYTLQHAKIKEQIKTHSQITKIQARTKEMLYRSSPIIQHMGNRS